MWRHKITSQILMICGNTSDFIDHPLSKHFVSGHGVSHHAWAPPSKSGTGCSDSFRHAVILHEIRWYQLPLLVKEFLIPMVISWMVEGLLFINNALRKKRWMLPTRFHIFSLQGFSRASVGHEMQQWINFHLVMKHIPWVFSGFQTYSDRCRFGTKTVRGGRGLGGRVGGQVRSSCRRNVFKVGGV